MDNSEDKYTKQIERELALAKAKIEQQQELLNHQNDELNQMKQKLNIADKDTNNYRKEADSNSLKCLKLESELKIQKEYLTAFHNTSIAMTKRLNIKEILETIVSKVLEIFKTEAGFLYLINEEQNEMVLEVGQGHYKKYLGYKVKPGEGLVGKAWISRAPIIINDYQSWEGRHPDPSWDKLQSLVGIPIKTHQKVLGVIGLHHVQEGKIIGEDDQAILVRFAELASIALDNATLYENLQKQYEFHSSLTRTVEQLIGDLELNPLLNEIILHVSNQVSSASGFLYLYETTSNALELKVGLHELIKNGTFKIQPGEGLVGKIWQTGEAMRIDNYCSWEGRHPDPIWDSVHSMAGIPLKSNDIVLGVIGLLRTEKRLPFSDSDYQTLDSFAKLATLSVQAANLLRITKKELDDKQKNESIYLRTHQNASRWHETTLNVIGQLDLDQLINEILFAAAELSRTNHGFFILYNEEEKVLEIKIGIGIYSHHVGYKVKEGDGLVGKIWEGKRSLIINDYQNWKGRHPDAIWNPVQAIMGVPLKSGDKVTGLLGLFTTEPGHSFDFDDFTLLEKFAKLASISLENSKLYHAAQKTLDEKRQIEQTLITRETKYRNTYENALEGIFKSDSDGILIDINPAFAKMFGFKSPDDLINSDFQPLNDFFEQQEAGKRFTYELLKKGQIIGQKVTLKRSDDKEIQVLISTRSTFDENGQAEHFDGFVLDMS